MCRRPLVRVLPRRLRASPSALGGGRRGGGGGGCGGGVGSGGGSSGSPPCRDHPSPPGSDSPGSQLRSAATTHPKPTLALRRRMRPGGGGRGSGEEGRGGSGRRRATTTELALWQPDASHRRARTARLFTAGARAPALPRRPRRRVPHRRRAGARGREERSRARPRCASAQARGETAAGRALSQSRRRRGACRCWGGLQPLEPGSPAPGWRKKREKGSWF